MLRPRLDSWSRLRFLTVLIAVGCVEDLSLETPPIPPGAEGSTLVEAQFDPTHPIPVLTLIPTPTILAQNLDGTLNQDAVRPDDCELPTSAQCLAFVEGWPTSTEITLFFSDEIDLTTLPAGIELYEVTATGLVSVPLDFDNARFVERTPPGPDRTADPSADPNACQTAFGYTDADIAPGYDLFLRPLNDAVPTTPAADFKLSTQYILLVKSDATGGLRDLNANPIQPSGLFFLLNDDTDPVSPTGEITSALLRSQVQEILLAAEFEGRLVEELTPTERETLDALVIEAGQDLYPVFLAVDEVITTSLEAGLVQDRSALILTNTWTTGGPPRPTVAFDPEAGELPFPNDELLTTVDPSTGQRRVNLPAEGTPIPAEWVGGLNKLDGFSLRTPAIGSAPQTGPTMFFTTEAPADLTTLDAAIVMYRLDSTASPVEAITVTATSADGLTITVRPNVPLEPSTSYVVGVTNDLKLADGRDYAVASTFDLLKTPVPLVDDEGVVLPDVVPALQCAPLTQGEDSLANVDQVRTSAQSLEPLRILWQPTFAALEAQQISRTDLLLAWSYTTQSITNDVDDIKARLFNGAFDDVGSRVTSISTIGTSTIANRLTDRVCTELCDDGQLLISGPQCMDSEALTNDPVCQLAIDLLTSELGSAELFQMRAHRVVSGSPFVDGTFSSALVENPAIENVPVWVVRPVMPAPPTGYPVLIFQHGLGQSKDDGFLIANTYAAAGWATVMFDLPLHGDRTSDLSEFRDIPGVGLVEVPCEEPFVDPAGVTCGPNGTCTDRNGLAPCDGMQDSSGFGYLSANFSGVRDNLRQSTIDQLTLLYTLQQVSGPTGAWSDLDARQVGFIGQSLGGITGANLLGYIDNQEIDAAVLNVAGGDWIEFLENSILAAEINAQLDELGLCELDPASGCQLTPEFADVLTLADWALQAADPIQTGRFAVDRLGTDGIMMQVAIPDLVVPNVMSESLAGVYGFSTSGPVGPYQAYDFSRLPEATSGLGCHDFLLEPSCGVCFEEALCATFGAQEQSATFIASGGQTIAPQPFDFIRGDISCSCAGQE